MQPIRNYFSYSARLPLFVEPPYDLFNTGSLFVNVFLTIPWANTLAKWASLIHYGLLLNLWMAIPIFVFKVLWSIDYAPILIALAYNVASFLQFFFPRTFGVFTRCPKTL